MQYEDSNLTLWGACSQCVASTPYCISNISTIWTCMTVSYSVPTTQSTIVTLYPQSYLSIYPSVPFATDTNWDGEDSNLTSFLVNPHCHSWVRRDQRRNLSLELRPIVGVTGFEPATSWSQTRRSTRLSHTPIDRLFPRRIDYYIVRSGTCQSQKK